MLYPSYDLFVKCVGDCFNFCPLFKFQHKCHTIHLCLFFNYVFVESYIVF